MYIHKVYTYAFAKSTTLPLIEQRLGVYERLYGQDIVGMNEYFPKGK